MIKDMVVASKKCFNKKKNKRITVKNLRKHSNGVLIYPNKRKYSITNVTRNQKILN